MSDDEELNIDYDKYKYECCSITNEECNGFSCRTCEVAIEENEYIKEARNKAICTFKKQTQNDTTLEINLDNTIVKCKTVDEFFTYIGDRADFKKYNNVKGLIGNDTIEKEYPLYNTILEELKPKTCTESYYLQDYPFVAVHDDMVLVIAPIIHSDEN